MILWTFENRMEEMHNVLLWIRDQLDAVPCSGSCDETAPCKRCIAHMLTYTREIDTKRGGR